jgi:anti-sigma factor RsiW
MGKRNERGRAPRTTIACGFNDADYPELKEQVEAWRRQEANVSQHMVNALMAYIDPSVDQLLREGLVSEHARMKRLLRSIMPELMAGMAGQVASAVVDSLIAQGIAIDAGQRGAAINHAQSGVTANFDEDTANFLDSFLD